MNRVEPKKCKGLEIITYSDDVFANISRIKMMINDNKAVIIKSMAQKNLLKEIRQYLFNVGTNSLPAYHAIDKKIPDHHLILRNHPDSQIKSYAHKFYFYPWNQNIFDFFSVFKNVFAIKNLLSDLDAGTFSNSTPLDSDYVWRCLFHHYPTGGGFIAKHADTVGEHQHVTAIVALSKKGVDFTEGGLYVMDDKENKIHIDDELDEGDVLFFNPEIEHGVDDISGNKNLGFLDQEGRWIMIAATIKTARNTTAKVAIEIA